MKNANTDSAAATLLAAADRLSAAPRGRAGEAHETERAALDFYAARDAYNAALAAASLVHLATGIGTVLCGAPAATQITFASPEVLSCPECSRRYVEAVNNGRAIAGLPPLDAAVLLSSRA